MVLKVRNRRDENMANDLGRPIYMVSKSTTRRNGQGLNKAQHTSQVKSVSKNLFYLHVFTVNAVPLPRFVSRRASRSTRSRVQNFTF